MAQSPSKELFQSRHPYSMNVFVITVIKHILILVSHFCQRRSLGPLPFFVRKLLIYFNSLRGIWHLHLWAFIDLRSFKIVHYI